MNQLNQLLVFANEFAQAFPWPALATSGLIAPMLSAYKHWLQIEGDKTYSIGKLKIKGEVIIFAILIVLSAAPGIVQAFMNALNGTPFDMHVFIIQTGLNAFLSQPVYLLIIKPAMRSYQASIDKQVEQRMAQLIVPAAASPAPVPATEPTQFK